MQSTLKMLEKLDNLLSEADEYVSCANIYSADPDLKAAYIDLARCHYDGYEKLSKCSTRITERKYANMTSEQKHMMQELVDWHKDKFDDRAAKIKMRLEQFR